MRPKSFECDEGFFTLLSRSFLRRTCEISLPQKTSPICAALRAFILNANKSPWKLDTSSWGFERLHLFNKEKPQWFGFAIWAMADPFRRFYFEDYLQTVLLSDRSKIVYNKLFNSGVTKKKWKISNNNKYKMLSKFFELAAHLGGVSMNYYFYAHCYFKRKNLDNKRKRQASYKQTSKQTKQNTL